jgi:hypothetical protein
VRNEKSRFSFDMSKPPKSELPDTVGSKTVAALAGLTERRLRQLADEGWFPAPVRGRWKLAGVMGGLLRYYRALVEESQDDKLKEVRRLLLEDELKKNRGQLVEADAIGREIVRAYSETKQRLLAVPGQLAVRCGINEGASSMASELIRDALEMLSKLKP